MPSKKVHILLKESVANDPALREEALQRIVGEMHIASQTPRDRLEYGIVTAHATDEQISALLDWDAVESVSDDEEKSAI